MAIRSGATLAVALIASCVVYATIYRLEALQPLGPLRNLVATLLATIPYAAAVWASRGRVGNADLALLLLGTVLLRLCIPLDLLVGTDDAYRYLWDGRVLDHGINPYAFAPDAPELAALRDPHFHPLIFRPDMRTVYPPLAELWFWVAYKLSPDGLGGLKVVLLIHDLASAVLLWRLCRALGHGGMQALVYAWSPLAVVQLAASAHLDGLMIPWCLLAVLLEVESRTSASLRASLGAGAALGAATMVRPTMGLCLPALVAGGATNNTARGLSAVGFAASVLGLALPFRRAGSGLWESLLIYARHWRFNGSLFRVVEVLFGHRLAARIVAYGAMASISLVGAWLPISLSGRFLIAVSAYLALAPTVYPWYALPAVALGTLHLRALVVVLPALLGLSDLVFLHKAQTGTWEVPTMALLVEYIAIYGLLALEARKLLATKRQSTM